MLHSLPVLASTISWLQPLMGHQFGPQDTHGCMICKVETFSFGKHKMLISTQSMGCCFGFNLAFQELKYFADALLPTWSILRIEELAHLRVLIFHSWKLPWLSAIHSSLARFDPFKLDNLPSEGEYPYNWDQFIFLFGALQRISSKHFHRANAKDQSCRFRQC